MKFNNKLLLVTGALSAFIAAGAGWYITKLVNEQTDILPKINKTVVMATTHQPERYTELYFENHFNLPNKIEPGEEQSFKFTIHNLEYETFTYNFLVSAISDSENITISSGSATLAQNEFKTIDESYTLATSSGRTKIQVLLVNKDQPIQFWLEE